jgi:hypothetical protein
MLFMQRPRIAGERLALDIDNSFILLQSNWFPVTSPKMIMKVSSWQ